MKILFLDLIFEEESALLLRRSLQRLVFVLSPLKGSCFLISLISWLWIHLSVIVIILLKGSCLSHCDYSKGISENHLVIIWKIVLILLKVIHTSLWHLKSTFLNFREDLWKYIWNSWIFWRDILRLENIFQVKNCGLRLVIIWGFDSYFKIIQTVKILWIVNDI